ncbi:hypothetical protein [Bacillus sp. CH_203]|uniref:hypothetical protein n=1 Tax=Bacillus sp. CH_203 TaxID=2978216 RepID=UPI0030F8C53B|nr:hypothetical protein [Bacillus cereus]
MKVNICNFKKGFTLAEGDLIVAQAKNGSGSVRHYLIVKESDKQIASNFRLLNISSSNILASFCSKIPENAIAYIEETLKCVILDVIPAEKLQIGLK